MCIRDSVYIDDFEGTQNKIDLRDVNSWKLASTPVGYKGYDFGRNNSGILYIWFW